MSLQSRTYSCTHEMHVPWYSFRFWQHNSGLQSQCALCMEWHFQTSEIFITHSPGSKQIQLFMLCWLLHSVTDTRHSLLKGSLMPLSVWSCPIRWLFYLNDILPTTSQKSHHPIYELLLSLDNVSVCARAGVHVVLVCNEAVLLNKLKILDNSTERLFCAVYVLMSL
jgi:hypothetical protein